MYVKYWDDALSPNMIEELKSEVAEVDLHNQWTKVFTRAGSKMYETNDRYRLPALERLYNITAQPYLLESIERDLHLTGVVPDPHMIGSGYSKIVDHGDLKPHIDFNWNDKLKLYRVATLIVYLSTPEEGGEIEFEGTDKIAVKENRAVLFEHSESIRHFVHPVKGERFAVRFFYYASKLEAPVGYHRSLYGFENGTPTDISDT